MLKLIFSIIGGLVAAFVIVFAADALFHAVSTTPMPADRENDAAMAAYVASLPTGTLAGLVAGWAVATLVGSAIAARFGGRGTWPGWVVTGLFLLATAGNFWMVTHPLWMVVVAIVAIIAAGRIGSRWGARSAARPVLAAG